jgi:hypothetical protein
MNAYIYICIVGMWRPLNKQDSYVQDWDSTSTRLQTFETQDGKCEKQGKTPQKDAKINPKIRRKKVSKTGKRLDSKTIKKKPEIGRRAKNMKNIN